MFHKEMVRQHLRRLRIDNGNTLEALANALGVSRGTVSRWESGIRIPELESLWKLADFYNLSLDELVGRKR